MNEYPYIVAWCKYLGSYKYFIKEEIARAIKFNAPQRAISQRQDGTWATVDDIQSPVVKDVILKMVEESKND